MAHTKALAAQQMHVACAKTAAGNGKAIDICAMRADGHVFYRSANGVWLVEHVPSRYLRVM